MWLKSIWLMVKSFFLKTHPIMNGPTTCSSENKPSVHALDRMTLLELKGRILQECESSLWWATATPTCQTEIQKIIESMDVVGPSYICGFLSIFSYEHLWRVLEKRDFNPTIHGAFKNFHEEFYQCGLLPTRVMLRMDDWERPLDSDVLAAIHLCVLFMQLPFAVTLRPAEEQVKEILVTIIEKVSEIS